MTDEQKGRLEDLKMFHAAKRAGLEMGREEFLALSHLQKWDVALAQVFCAVTLAKLKLVGTRAWWCSIVLDGRTL